MRRQDMSYYLVPKNGGEKYKREGYFSIKSRLAIWLAEEALYIGTLVLIRYRHPGIMDRLAGNIKWIVLATIAISLALASLSQYLVEEKLMRFAFSHGIKISVWTLCVPNLVVVFLVFFIAFHVFETVSGASAAKGFIRFLSLLFAQIHVAFVEMIRGIQWQSDMEDEDLE